MKSYGEILKELRKSHGLRQQDVTVRLNGLGIKTGKSQVSRWEKGYNNPNIQQFLGLLEIYSVRDAYSVFEKGLSPSFTGLNAAGLKKLDEYRDLLISSGLYTVHAEPEDIPENLRYLPVYDIAASAGTGQFLDSDSYELKAVPPEVPESASFGIRVAGDSMEPTLKNGDVVWVRRQNELNSGDIGIFYLDGCAYVKEYKKDKDGISLISHNSAYAPIRVDREDSRIYGRVIYPAL